MRYYSVNLKDDENEGRFKYVFKFAWLPTKTECGTIAWLEHVGVKYCFMNGQWRLQTIELTKDGYR